MKKTLAALLSLLLLLAFSLTAVSCKKKRGEERETENGTPATSEESANPGESQPAGTGDTGSETTGNPAAPGTDEETTAPAGSVDGEVEEPLDPGYPPFDKTKAWDGKNGCLRWYITAQDGFEIKNAYDLYGLSRLVEAAGTGKLLYYDPNYMIILDTDGDGEVSDEQGYNAKRMAGGDRMAGCEIVLKSDISLNGKLWLPIGSSCSFEGVFLGKGHTVSNFYVTGETAAHKTMTQSYYGFFSLLADGAEVRNLTVEKATFTVESRDGKNNDVYLGVFGASTGKVKIVACNAYDITYNVKKMGTPNTLKGYILSRADNAGTMITRCKVYNYKFEGISKGFMEAPNEWLGLDRSHAAQVTDCEKLSADPRKS